MTLLTTSGYGPIIMCYSNILILRYIIISMVDRNYKKSAIRGLNFGGFKGAKLTKISCVRF